MSDAKAVFFEEWCRNGGGEKPPSREPGRVGRWLRGSANHLVQRELQRVAELRRLDLSRYPELQASERTLIREFSRIAAPGFAGALAAARAIFRFGIRA